METMNKKRVARNLIIMLTVAMSGGLACFGSEKPVTIVISDYPQNQPLCAAIVDKLSTEKEVRFVHTTDKTAAAKATDGKPEVEGVITIGMLSLGDGIKLAAETSPKYFASIGGVAMSGTEYARWLNKLVYHYPGTDTDYETATRKRIEIDRALMSNTDSVAKNGALPFVVEKLASIDMPKLLEQLTVPVITINGMNDRLVPWYENISAYEASVPYSENNCHIAWPNVDGQLVESAVTLPPFAMVDTSSQKSFEPNEEVLSILYDWIDRTTAK